MAIMRGLRKGAQSAKNPVTDLAAYPILTEEVGYPPSPLAKPSGTSGGNGHGSIGQMVTKAMSDVLGWKVKPGDTKGFVGALTQSFSLTEVEGHVESKWTPRTYIVQSDLSGGITGAQASVYTRGKEALDQALPLLDGLYTLDPEADTEDVTALKAVVKSQFTELVNELGFLGGPRITRVNQYFRLLLIDSDSPSTFPPFSGAPPLVVDPDMIGGTLGNLRDVLGLNFSRQDFVNSVEDEQDLSNYRIISDYVTSLAQSWINNLPFLGLDSAKPFFGTQLVLLSRQLMVVAESVDEVRFTMDSVFIGPSERQATEIKFPGHPELKSLFLEDLFSWIRNFATEEGPALIQDGGKFAVKNTVKPILKKLVTMVSLYPTSSSASNPWPPAFFAPRVMLAIENLVAELTRFLALSKPIEHDITSEPDFGLPFQVLTAGPVSLSELPAGPAGAIAVQVRGNGFQATPAVSLSSGPYSIPISRTLFRSESLLMVVISKAAIIGPGKGPGNWDVTVVNADGTQLTQRGAFAIGL